MLALVIFLTINLTKIINYASAPKNYVGALDIGQLGQNNIINTAIAINWPLIYFFLAITLIENLFISYEKFYIAQEKSCVILIINALSIITLSGIILYSHFFEQFGQSMLLFLITVTRATFFLILAAISFYKWRIKPKVAIKPIYIAISVLISLVVFGLL